MVGIAGKYQHQSSVCQSISQENFEISTSGKEFMDTGVCDR